MDQHLDFEQPIYTCLEKIEQLKKIVPAPENLAEEIAVLERQSHEETEKIYANLSPWQKVLVARHPNRPHTLDYIANVFEGFEEMHGDRLSEDDKAIVAGLGFFDEKPVAVIGHEKGRETAERVERNFGMPHPSGFRKANRVMKLAEKFSLPLITLIDTPGAYPGIGAEQRGQAIAIANSIECCMSLKVPNISIIIGEGGSGGAIALASSNKVIMLEHSIYSVISPEGCASILWRDPSKSLEAAEAMKLTAQQLLKLGIVDEVVEEPLGGAHRDHKETAEKIKNIILKYLENFESLSGDQILNHRKTKFLKVGRDQGFKKAKDTIDNNLAFVEPTTSKIIRLFQKRKSLVLGSAIVLILLVILSNFL